MVELGILPSVVTQLAEEKRLAYLDRRGSFSDFAWAQVEAYQGQARLRGIRVSDAEFAAQEVMREKGRRVHRFTDQLAKVTKAAGMECVIISGSIYEAVEAFAKVNDITHFFGTKDPRVDGFYTGGEAEAWSHRKDEVVHKIVREHGVDLATSVAIGDSASDAKMLGLVGYPICFNPERALLEVARMRQWPVVWEKKNVTTYFQTNAGCWDLRERQLTNILPRALADLMAQKLV